MQRIIGIGCMSLLAIGPTGLQAASASTPSPRSFAPGAVSNSTGNMSDRLAPLAWFLGQWHCQGKFPNGKSIHSTETFSPMLDGHWLRMQHHDVPPHAYDAVEWWGYDTAKKHFVADVYDNAGGVRHYTSLGWSNDTLSLENTATKGYVDRFVFRRLGDSRYRVAYDHKNAPGPWKHGDVLTCTRIPAPSTPS